MKKNLLFFLLVLVSFSFLMWGSCSDVSIPSEEEILEEIMTRSARNCFCEDNCDCLPESSVQPSCLCGFGGSDGDDNDHDDKDGEDDGAGGNPGYRKDCECNTKVGNHDCKCGKGGKECDGNCCLNGNCPGNPLVCGECNQVDCSCPEYLLDICIENEYFKNINFSLYIYPADGDSRLYTKNGSIREWSNFTDVIHLRKGNYRAVFNCSGYMCPGYHDTQYFRLDRNSDLTFLHDCGEEDEREDEF